MRKLVPLFNLKVPIFKPLKEEFILKGRFVFSLLIGFGAGPSTH